MGSRNWDPNKVLGISEEDIRAVEERRQMRSRIKAEWVQKSTNPYRGYGGNIVSFVGSLGRQFCILYSTLYGY